MKKDKRNKPGKKKQPKKRERINKKYKTNVDTISLNCLEFCPGWMRTSLEEHENESGTLVKRNVTTYRIR